MQTYREKIKSLEELKRLCQEWKASGQRIVFTNGCFDILHPGHVRYLEQAAALGDRLVVGVNSDRSVTRLKGPSRPVMDQASRAELLAALVFVNAVVIFDEDTPYRLIQELMPHVLVKGGDWPEDKIVGADIVKVSGGMVKSIPYVEGFATTSLISRILELNRPK